MRTAIRADEGTVLRSARGSWVMSRTTCVSPVWDCLRSPRWPRRTCGMKPSLSFWFSPVSACPVASRAQMRAQISLPACTRASPIPEAQPRSKSISPRNRPLTGHSGGRSLPDPNGLREVRASLAVAVRWRLPLAAAAVAVSRGERTPSTRESPSLPFLAASCGTGRILPTSGSARVRDMPVSLLPTCLARQLDHSIVGVFFPNWLSGVEHVSVRGAAHASGPDRFRPGLRGDCRVRAGRTVSSCSR